MEVLKIKNLWKTSSRKWKGKLLPERNHLNTCYPTKDTCLNKQELQTHRKINNLAQRRAKAWAVISEDDWPADTHARGQRPAGSISGSPRPRGGAALGGHRPQGVQVALRCRYALVRKEGTARPSVCLRRQGFHGKNQGADNALSQGKGLRAHILLERNGKRCKGGTHAFHLSGAWISPSGESHHLLFLTIRNWG